MSLGSVSRPRVARGGGQCGGWGAGGGGGGLERRKCASHPVNRAYTVRDTGGLALNSDYFLHKTLREVKSKSLMASRSISKRKEAC
jgi:hypothetical protein